MAAEKHNDLPLLAQVQETLALALQVEKELVTPDLNFGDLPQWDSLGHMEVMMRLEEKFGVEITADTIAALVSVPEICKHIARLETRASLGRQEA